MLKMLLIVFTFWSSVSKAEFQFGLNVFLSGHNSEIAESDINPDNQILKLPVLESFLDVQPDLKWLSKKNKLIIRPRWIGTYRVSENYVSGERPAEARGKLNLSDAFVETNWTPLFSTTVGLQVYQWGPAEFLSPSNPLFNFNAKQRGLLYKEKGQVLLRGNISFNKENSLVFILQPISNNEPEKKFEDNFDAKGLLKFEKSWQQGSNYAGLIGGYEEDKSFFVGEYFSLMPIEGISFYGDFKHAQTQNIFVPVLNGSTFNMISETRDWQSLSIIGLRYEADFDVRFEYIFNQFGFDNETLVAAIASGSTQLNPNYPLNLNRFLGTGLQLLGQQYVYASLRVAEPFDIVDSTVYARGVLSLQDSSLQFQLEADYAFGDSLAGLVSGSYNFGRVNTEFRLLNNWEMIAGVKYSF